MCVEALKEKAVTSNEYEKSRELDKVIQFLDILHPFDMTELKAFKKNSHI